MGCEEGRLSGVFPVCRVPQGAAHRKGCLAAEGAEQERDQQGHKGSEGAWGRKDAEQAGGRKVQMALKRSEVRMGSEV